MDAPPMIWVFRAACVALAFTTAEALDVAASDWSGGARLQLALAGWALWILCTLAGWFRRAVSVAVLRCTTPIALGIVTAVVASSDWNLGLGWKVSGLACTWAVTVAAFLPQFSEWFVNGVSYGDEHRMVLRPPLPIAAVVAVVVLIGAVVAVAGSALVQNGLAWIGVLCWIAAPALVSFAIAASTKLLRRTAIFVPAGITIVDDANLSDPVLLARQRIASVRLLGACEVLAEPEGDLGKDAPGRSIAVRLMVPVDIARREGNSRTARASSVDLVRFVPTRATAFAAFAQGRALSVGLSPRR